MTKCSCYSQSWCYGIKEAQKCSCGGDESKCEFPKNRKRKETEKRLIDANDLLSAIDEYMGNVYGCPLNEVAEFQSASNDTKVIYAVEGLYEATEIIDEQPTVDAVEVVHGRWEDMYGGKYDNYRFRCSVCKEKSLFKDKRNKLGNWITVQALSDYCPNCGAKMDGDGNGIQ